MKNILKLILILSVIASSVFAQTSAIDGQPRFKGTVKLPGNIKSSFDTLSITYQKPYTPIDGNLFEGMKIITDKNGNFSFKLPKYPQPYYLDFAFALKLYKVEHYFVESNDDIKIEITMGNNGDSAKFSGRGAEKYNLANQLYKICYDAMGSSGEFIDSTVTLKLSEKGNLENKLLQYNETVRFFNKKKEDLIENSGLSPKMKSMVTYEHARIFQRWVSTMSRLYTNTYKGNDEARLVIRKNYNTYKQEFSYPFDTLMNLCPMYLITIADVETNSLYINAASDNLTLDAVYNNLKNKFKGDVLETLLTNFFIKRRGLYVYDNEIKYNDSEYKSLLTESINLVKRPMLKKMLSDKLRKSKGQLLFNASFKDINGKEISTDVLKGNVVLIDFWSIGCTGCRLFHDFFKKDIHPLLKGNKDFIYLSIGTNKKQLQWQQGINSGLYTSAEYINVSLGELGLNHPFAKYYNVMGLPDALLIDKNGKIYSSNKLLNHKYTLDLINEALKVPLETK